MRADHAVVEILKREGVTTLFCFPTTSVIETAVAGGLRPIICRQERVGVDMADGYARVTNGRPPGVFPQGSRGLLIGHAPAEGRIAAWPTASLVLKPCPAGVKREFLRRISLPIQPHIFGHPTCRTV